MSITNNDIDSKWELGDTIAITMDGDGTDGDTDGTDGDGTDGDGRRATAPTATAPTGTRPEPSCRRRRP